VTDAPRPASLRVRDLLQPGLWLLVWGYLYIVVMLTAWVLIVSLAAGWRPVVITAGSMSPSIRAGDVILIEDAGRQLAQGSVITFDDPVDPGQTVTHRVFEVVEGGYVTKGDANPTPDPIQVSEDQVRGAARLVVPFVGMPVLWWKTGNHLGLGAFALMTVLALLVGVSGTRRRMGEAATRGSWAGPVVAQKALRRVRVLVGALIGAQFLTDPERLELIKGHLPAAAVLAGTLATLAGLNLGSLAVARRGSATLGRRFSMLELVVDTALVIAITAPSGTAGIGWVLFALPIVEAATRFRLTGALLHWMGLTAVTIMTRITTLQAAGIGGALMLKELERTMDQLSVLLLVVLPGAYLAEQLLNDVTMQIHATNESRARNRVLQRVVDIGRDVNRLDSEIVQTLTASALALGFDGTDAWATTGDGSWRRLSSAGAIADQLPAPGLPASGLRPHDLLEQAVIVDHADPDAAERAGLQEAGVALLARVRLVEVDGTAVVLRAALSTENTSNALALEGLELLASQASVAMRNDRLIAELRAAHAGLFRQASHDALTGLANRPHFLEALRAALAKSRLDPRSEVAVLFLDLDGFKQVNDRLGHENGDVLLRAAGARIVARLRDDDLVARFGGDEFTVLLNNGGDRRTVGEVASRIHAAIGTPFGIANGQVAIGVSIGIAMSDGQQDSPDEILRRADMAMYHAKTNGALGWAFYEEEMGERSRYRARLADELPAALSDGRLHLAFQPLYDVGPDRRIVGAEALLRWDHPALGPIPPPEIIDLAEQLGVRDELTRFVLHGACDAAAFWRDAATESIVVTANLTPSELESPDLLAHVGTALRRANLDPDLLILELSERILGPDNPASDANLYGLDAMGVRLILDDFGQGRTSLAFLRSLPIEGIKLDREFVVNSVRSPDDRIIVESVVKLAHELSLFVVAEGVEVEAHLATVEAMGCDLLQGYYLSHPIDRVEFSRLLVAQPIGPIGATSPLSRRSTVHSGGES